jgi:hypothetical protein
MYYYTIAGIKLAVETDNKYIIDTLEPFSSGYEGKADITVEMDPQTDIPTPQGEFVTDENPVKWKKRLDGEGYTAYLMTPADVPVAVVEGDPEWTRCRVFYKSNIISCDFSYRPSDELALKFLGIAFRNHIIYKNAVVLHASCIEYQGNGIAFSAPSGTGKSTHTALWEQLKEGAKVLNDDAPVIRLIDGEPVLYGAPWSGSSNKFINSSAPLKAIVLLEQAKENSVQRLSIAESVAGVMPRLLLPYHDSKLMDLALSTFNQIIALTPVYILKCRPDAEAVELVYQCVM